MTKAATTARIDLRRHPYRGIVSEVARELEVSQPAVSRRMKNGDPVVLALVVSKMNERERVVERFNAKMEGDA